jgi:hypothetical protein
MFNFLLKDVVWDWQNQRWFMSTLDSAAVSRAEFGFLKSAMVERTMNSMEQNNQVF